jgi:hypothetical protein
MRRRARAVAVTVAVVLAFAASMLPGCAIRYDRVGVTRVGVFLWGFGDPPGVRWNLDWPREEVSELPAAAPSELPPRRAPRDRDAFVPGIEAVAGSAAAIDDNRKCAAPGCVSTSPAVPLASRADARNERSARH